MTEVVVDLRDYAIHKMVELQKYYKMGSYSDVVEWLLDDKYAELPEECAKCGSREFRIKDEFLGA